MAALAHGGSGGQGQGRLLLVGGLVDGAQVADVVGLLLAGVAAGKENGSKQRNFTRHPHPSSLEPTKREALAKTGHYRTLTYETFLLPLLSEWAGLAQPEKVKHFLLDFLYQVERQLNFPSTAPTATMY